MVIKEVARAITDVTDIRYLSEQQFFLLVKGQSKFGCSTLFSGCPISYEPHLYKATNEETNSEERALPDFEVGDPETFSAICEITIESKNNIDSKEKIKRIMAKKEPNKPFLVFYREDLEQVQRCNTGVNFFSSKLIRKDEPTLESCMYT